MRLLIDPAGPADWNMAVDEALLEAVASGAPPALRFYDWDPPAVSLGYSQPLTDVNLEACQRTGVAVVRRPTGGRAVLHHAELTYAIVQPIPPGESVRASYCRLSGALAAALGTFGISAGIEPGEGCSRDPDSRIESETERRAKPHKPDQALPRQPVLASLGRRSRPASCFAVATAADLVAAGHKIAGSAQVRRRGALLQHGSLKLAPSPLSILPEPPTTLADLLGVQAPDAAWLATMRDRLARAIAAQLGVSWQPRALSKEESALARELVTRYQAPT